MKSMLWAIAVMVETFVGPAYASSWRCKHATSCDEAVREWCGGYADADRDNDGIPCENVCKSREQVNTAKKRGACG